MYSIIQQPKKQNKGQFADLVNDDDLKDYLKEDKSVGEVAAYLKKKIVKFLVKMINI